MCIRDSPWDTARILHTYVLVGRETELPVGLPEGTLVRTPVEKALVYSSVHCGLLSELGAIDRIGGICDQMCIRDRATANKARYMSVRGIVEAYNKEVEVWGFEHISVEEEKLGLKGSPTRVWKSFTKGAKAAGKVFEVEPAEAADIIVEKLKEKFII